MTPKFNFDRELFVNNFAGGGGTDCGIAMAIGHSCDIAINHDPEAIAMHMINHPHTYHYCEDVFTVSPKKACAGRPVALAWFSPDCRHHSKAKGGTPVDKKIRGLAWVAVRWAKEVRPRVIILENVEEFRNWCPLLDGRPDPAKKGETFQKFVQSLEKLGYKVEWRELLACDYGSPTSRNRFFLIARCDEQAIVWPQPTHAKPESPIVRAGILKPWIPAYQIIDWSIPMRSIFERKKPLVENTMRRIAKGIQKFVLNNEQPFILPCDITEQGYEISASSILQYHSEKSSKEVRGQSLTRPLMSIDGSPRYALVSSFLSKYFAGGYKGAGVSLHQPLPTVTAVDHNALVTSYLRKVEQTNVIEFSGHKLLAKKNNSAKVSAFLLKYYGADIGQSLLRPLHTVTAKARFGIVTIFGQDYRICDIAMRMLEPRELFDGNGFKRDYIIDFEYKGKPFTKTAKIAKVGNSVPPQMSEALVRANLPEYCLAKAS